MEIENTNGSPETLDTYIPTKILDKKLIKKRFILLNILLVLSILLLLSPFRIGVIDGDSMEPTLKHGQIFLYNYRYYKKSLPAKNDVILLRKRKDTIIKRVAGLPKEEIIYYSIYGNLEWTIVPDNTIFVLGDNIMYSIDSRDFGPIAINSIIGKVIYPNVENYNSPANAANAEIN